ncbi:MAG: hypothetical protein ABWY57_00360 [Mycetocola sp.]
MTRDLLVELRELQDADGCFLSDIVASGIRSVDRNGYVAALVLRTLRHHPPLGLWCEISDRALDWVSRCRSPRLPAAFAFWPESTRPDWAAGVPADVDDTAVMLTELLRHGRVDRPTALRSVCTVILACRVVDDSALRPPWVAQGSYLTWVAGDARPTSSSGKRTPPNLVDACVNANVVALLALLDATHLPGYRAAVSTVRRGTAWAGEDQRMLAALTPFYPAPRSLADAVAHAVECGVEELRETQDRLERLPAAMLDSPHGSCRSAWGHTIWHAPALDLATAIAGQRRW